MHPASLIFQKSFWNMAETKLNVTQDLEKPFTIVIFPYTDSWCLVPFSSNVSWDPKHKGIDCFAVAIKSIAYIQGKGGRSVIHSKKYLIRSWLLTNIIPVTATTLSRVNRGCSYMFTHKIHLRNHVRSQ